MPRSNIAKSHDRSYDRYMFKCINNYLFSRAAVKCCILTSSVSEVQLVHISLEFTEFFLILVILIGSTVVCHPGFCLCSPKVNHAERLFIRLFAILTISVVRLLLECFT